MCMFSSIFRICAAVSQTMRDGGNAWCAWNMQKRSSEWRRRRRRQPNAGAKVGRTVRANIDIAFGVPYFTGGMPLGKRVIARMRLRTCALAWASCVCANVIQCGRVVGAWSECDGGQPGCFIEFCVRIGLSAQVIVCRCVCVCVCNNERTAAGHTELDLALRTSSDLG